MAQETAATIIKRVSAECGLPVPSNPFASTDQNQTLLVTLLNGAGVELVGTHPWPILDRTLELDFADSAGVGSFYVPDDWAYIHPQTIWDTTTGRPVNGPLTPQEWAAQQASFFSGATPSQICFRQTGPALQFLPSPVDTATVITLEYTSSCWAQGADGAAKEEVTEPDDVVLLDGQLVSRLLKLRWLESKGMATGPASADFKGTLDDAIRKANGSGKVLSMSGGPLYVNIPVWRLPETGWGN